MSEPTKEIIVLPNLLLNPLYIGEMDQPLDSIADVLDSQGKHEFALACRNAAIICKTFSKVHLDKTHELYLP